MKQYGVEALWAAFAYATAEDIIVADERLTRSEVDVLRELDESMRKAGLMRTNGTLVDHFDEVRAQAEDKLATLLSSDDKLRLITLFHKVSRVDGDLDKREGVHMKHAAEVLGLPQQEYLDHLASLYL